MTTSDVTEPFFPDELATAGEPDDGTPAPPAPKARRTRRGKLIVLGVVASLIVAVGLVAGWYLKTHKPLSQLPGMESGKVPQYAFSIYGVTRPLGVAVNSSGERIYITQSDGARDVRAFNRDGKQVGVLKPPASTGKAHTPIYVAINPKTKDVYVSDRFTGAVYVYDEKGAYLRTFDPTKAKIAGNAGGKLAGWAPLGLAFASDGTLYVTDVGNGQRILAFAPDGSTVRIFGGSTGMSFPNGIAVDRRGNVEVTDSNNGRLLVFDKAGNVVATIGHGVGEGDLGLPRGVAVGDGNRLFIADTTDHMVRVYRVGTENAPTPAYVASFGSEGQLEGAFEYPNGVAVDSRARIYVTDRENNRVQVWSY